MSAAHKAETTISSPPHSPCEDSRLFLHFLGGCWYEIRTDLMRVLFIENYISFIHKFLKEKLPRYVLKDLSKTKRHFERKTVTKNSGVSLLSTVYKELPCFMD